MARVIHKLTDRQIKTAANAGMLSDGGGLYLQISRGGSKSWIYRFMMDGRSRDMGFGGYDTVSLSDAREKALEARKLVKAGVDPIEHRTAQRASVKVAAAKAVTFATCAQRFIDSHERGWRNPKHRQQWRNTLATYAYPIIGDLPVDTIDTGLVMRILEPIWPIKPETASRLRGRIEAVLDAAKAQELRSGENPARWRGHLDHLLPAKSKVRSIEHHAALPYDEIDM